MRIRVVSRPGCSEKRALADSTYAISRAWPPKKRVQCRPFDESGSLRAPALDLSLTFGQKPLCQRCIAHRARELDSAT